MWCNKCNIETNDSVCPLCGSKTVEDLPVEIFFGVSDARHQLSKPLLKRTRGLALSAKEKRNTCPLTFVPYFQRNDYF